MPVLWQLRNGESLVVDVGSARVCGGEPSVKEVRVRGCVSIVAEVTVYLCDSLQRVTESFGAVVT